MIILFVKYTKKETSEFLLHESLVLLIHKEVTCFEKNCGTIKTTIKRILIMKMKKEKNNMNTNIIEETARGLEIVSIEDHMYNERKIFMCEPVTSQSSANLIKQLMYLDHKDTGEEIELYISSPGGEVTAGLVICDFINTMKSPVTTICIGMAASMGAVIFMHGKKRKMLPHSQILIHDPSFGSMDMGGQKPMQLMEQVNDLMKVRKTLGEIIAKQTGMKLQSVYAKTKKDSVLSAEEAVECGIATEIV